jgi:precorrin-6A/cobalt-precorrin-6A reductase
MTRGNRTLVLAGAREAHALVTGLLGRRREVIASLPEEERMFDPLPVPTRVGRFASRDELEEWARAQRVASIIDASHAFDADVGRLAHAVARRMGIRYLRLLRPPWKATVRDFWKNVPSVREAARSLPATARAFSNTGWLTLPDYSEFSGAELFLRQTHAETSAPPFDFVRIVEGKPPFTQFQEEALFRQLRVTHLICRNVGGAASMSKLLAARTLGLPVVMIARAPLPADMPRVETVAEALAWEADG